MTNTRINKIEFINFDPRLKETIKDEILNALNLITEDQKIVSPVELALEFVDDKKIKQLNSQFRNVDRVTDVLSFPVFENMIEINKITKSDSILLGDIFININQAESQANEIGHSLEEEIVYLSIHSILHLLGYDHIQKIDKKVMRDLEKKILNKLQKNVRTQ